MNCTRCDGTGFLNIDQLPEDEDFYDVARIERWMKENSGHDVMICDCCGDGTGWYGEPGEHNSDSSVRHGWDTPNIPECI